MNSEDQRGGGWAVQGESHRGGLPGQRLRVPGFAQSLHSARGGGRGPGGQPKGPVEGSVPTKPLPSCPVSRGPACSGRGPLPRGPKNTARLFGERRHPEWQQPGSMAVVTREGAGHRALPSFNPLLCPGAQRGQEDPFLLSPPLAQPFLLLPCFLMLSFLQGSWRQLPTPELPALERAQCNHLSASFQDVLGVRRV